MRPAPKYQAFGLALQRVVYAAGDTQDLAADKLEVSPAYVSKLCNGRARPSWEMLQRIIAAYGLEDRREELQRLAGYSEGDLLRDPPESGDDRLLRLVEAAAEAAVRKALADPATPLEGVQFGRFESPRQAYERLIGEYTVRYGIERGYTLPQGVAHAGGGDFATLTDAEAAALVWLERIAELNPTRPAPEELSEG